MTVAELIERLQNFDPNMEVKIAQPTHDHWKNVLASDIDDVDELEVEYSDYHSSLVIGDGEEEYDDDDNLIERDYKTAIILR